jgi:uncharacterized protein (DUF885 family)
MKQKRTVIKVPPSSTAFKRLIPMSLLVVFMMSYFSVEQAHSATQTSGGEPVSTLIEIFDEDDSVLNRRYSVQYSHEYFERFDRFYLEWLARLDTLDFNSLSHRDRVDFHLLKNHIQRRAYFMKLDHQQFLAIENWLPDTESIMAFINTRRYGTKPDAKAVAAQMVQWAAQVDSLQALLQSSPPLLKKDANAASDALNDMYDNLKNAYDFYHGYDIEFTWWAEKPFENLTSAWTVYSETIDEYFDAANEQIDDSGIVGNPIGREEIERRLDFEMITYSPQELIDIAEHQFAKAEQEMLKASRELGFGDDWRAALEYVKEQYVEPGRKPELIMRLYNESMDFIEDRDMLSIPPLAKEVWRMEMMSPERQLVSPFFLGGEVIRISYPTNTMGHEAKRMSMRGNNPHFNRATVHHELIPGHHLQGFMTRRYSTYRSPFRTSFWGEGWALYWELLLWDKGFAETPEDRIGMLFWRTHRYARIIFSLNYHLGNWTPQQSIDYLVERVGHEYANAEAEVRRSFTGGYGPLYQIAYMIGGMHFYSLYQDLVENGDMNAKEFHDRILKEGSIPVRMVKSILTEEPLEKFEIEDWNFADYVYND